MIVNKYQKGGGSGSGSTVSWNQIVTGGTEIAQITIDGSTKRVYVSGSSVSYSQTLSAGTEVGQITIDGSATTIYAPQGGSSEQNYLIVGALSAITEPYEGLMAFVESGSTPIQYSGYTFSIEGLTGDGAVKYSNNYTSNYRFDGQGGVKFRDEKQGYQYVDLTSDYQYLDGRVYVKLDNGYIFATYATEANYRENTGILTAVTLTDTTLEIPAPYNGILYRYENGRWNNVDCIYLSDNGMGNAERAIVFNQIAAIWNAYSSNEEMLAKMLAYIRFRFFPVISLGKDGQTAFYLSYIENNGTLAVATLHSDGSLDKTYYPLTTIPTASASTLGGIKVGNGLSIDSNGVLSAKVVALSQAEYDALVQAGTVDATTLYVII